MDCVLYDAIYFCLKILINTQSDTAALHGGK
ncbi:hypothetical protein SRABI04_00473 [Chryseobacterium sp. Bi04]|nr:hypothetical protein SRABI04_00473 [Chryseobacterium sp. Bi04]